MNQNFSVCIISKFPPIEGGMSSKAYWLARGLAKKKIDVTILTNSNVVEKEYCVINGVPKKIKNLEINHISLSEQFHIPHRQHDIAGFIDSFLKIIKHGKIDLIDAHYLIPYGIVAHILSKMYNIPYIIRHGGSDIDKFLKGNVFEALLDRVLSEAAIVESNSKYVQSKSKRFIQLPPYVPNEKLFNTIGREKPYGRLRIAYIGKINRLWQYKGLNKIVDTFRQLRDKVELIFLTQGLGMEDFKSKVNTDCVTFYDFIPPWEMPLFYKGIDYIIYLCNNNPLPDWPNIVPEALLSGVKIITDNKIFFKKFDSLCADIDKFIIQLNMDDDPYQIYNQLQCHNVAGKYELLMNYDTYIEKNKQLYTDVLKKAEK